VDSVSGSVIFGVDSLQTITTQGSTIIVQPANPYPGIWFGGPYLSFGFGFGIGWVGGFGWGWNHWGFDWHNRTVIYNHNRYYYRSNTFYNRSTYYRGIALSSLLHENIT
jgi:hypothetical protein